MVLVAGWGASFRRDALRQGACQSKQRKIDTQQRPGFDGLDINMLQ
jgi:hypothetical protein